MDISSRCNLYDKSMFLNDLKTIVNEYTIKIYIPKMISVYNTKFLSKQKLQNPWYLLRKDEKRNSSISTYVYRIVNIER